MIKEQIPLSDEEVLTYTQGKRRQLVECITSKGIPEDKENRAVLLDALSGLDRVALGRMKIKVEEANGAATANNNALLSELLTRVPHNAFRVEKCIERNDLHLPDHLEDPSIIEGELAQQSSALTYDTFISKMKPEN